MVLHLQFQELHVSRKKAGLMQVINVLSTQEDLFLLYVLRITKN